MIGTGANIEARDETGCAPILHTARQGEVLGNCAAAANRKLEGHRFDGYLRNE